MQKTIKVLGFFLQDNIVEGEVNVDTKYHKHFVARRGEVLRHIGDDFGGVTVSFPRSGVKSERVVIKGAKDCVEGAKKRILEIVADLVGFSIEYIFFGLVYEIFILISYASWADSDKPLQTCNLV